MANWICTLYQSAIEAKIAIDQISNTVTLHVLAVEDNKLGKCVMVIKSV